MALSARKCGPTCLFMQQALKIEKVDKKGGKSGLLKAEHRVSGLQLYCQGSVARMSPLRLARSQTLRKLQASSHICRLVDGGFGTHEGRAYFVMELLGLNLAQLQRSVPNGRWDLRTVCIIGKFSAQCSRRRHTSAVSNKFLPVKQPRRTFCTAFSQSNGSNTCRGSYASKCADWFSPFNVTCCSTLRARLGTLAQPRPRLLRYAFSAFSLTAGRAVLDCLQSVHEAGFVHRDVKPPNFVLHRDQLDETGEWKAIDFGISRSYLAEDSSIVPAREGYQAFRGSTSYASVNAHKLHDLGTRLPFLFLLSSSRTHQHPDPFQDI